MAKTKEQKKEIVKFYKEKLHNTKAVYFIEAQKITANESNELKKSLYDLNSFYHILKNRIFKIALREENIPEIENITKGQHAAIFTNEDNLTVTAKIIYEFIKEKGDLKIKGGILDKEIISAEQVIELASLPGINDLRAKLVYTLNAPINDFYTVLSGNIRGLINIFNAIKNTKLQ